MKYLVTGGAGFIGSNLVEDLVREGNEIIVVDNLSTGSLDNLSSVKAQIKFIKAQAGAVLEMKELKNIDGVYHLGIPSSSPLYRKNPLLSGQAINEFIRVLDLARKENCKVVYPSSSSLYNGNKIPFKETLPILIKDFYTETRYSMERLAKLYYDFYSIKSIGLRLFSVYGPKEEAKKNLANLVSQFLWTMKAEKSPLIYGDGRQKRDFIYVSDVIDGFKLAMHSKIDCELFNLGTGTSHNLNELVSILNNILGTKIQAEYSNNPLKNYVFETLADINKTKKELGFEAKISLNEGVKKLLNGS